MGMRGASLELFKLSHGVVFLLPGVVQVPERIRQVAHSSVPLSSQVVAQRAERATPRVLSARAVDERRRDVK